MDEIVRYGEYLVREKHASQNTVASYLRDVNQFSDYLKVRGPGLLEATAETVQSYMDWMLSRGKSAASVTRFLASVKSFYNFQLFSGKVKTNPAKGVSAAKVERKYPEILTSKEVDLFLEQPRCVDAKGFRDHAMLELLYHPGPGRPESGRRADSLLQQGQGADHPPVPHGGEGFAGLRVENSSPAGVRSGGDRPVCQHER